VAADNSDAQRSSAPSTSGNASSRSAAALINRVLSGRYEILEFIGEGPLLAAYRARDRSQNRLVALKILLPQRAADHPSIAEKLRSGLGEVLSFSHPSITRTFDVGSDEDNGVAAYVSEEYIRGIDLKERIRRAAPFQLTAATDCAVALAEALEFAHNRGIAHGDVRPQNVLIGPEGQVKLSGFGVAEAQNIALYQDPGLLSRVVAYVAPDAAASSRPTVSADLYALGVILFEMLTGDLPFKGDNALQIALKHAQEPVPSPRSINLGIPRALDGVVQKTLGKRPEDRYLSAADMLTDLREVRDSLRYGKSLAWSPLDRPSIPSPGETRPEITVVPIPVTTAPAVPVVTVPPVPVVPPPITVVPSTPAVVASVARSYEEDESDATIVMPSTIRGASALEGRRVGASTMPIPTPANTRYVQTDGEDDYEEPRGRKRGARRNNGGNGSRWLTFINLFLGLALIGGIGGLIWMTMNFLQPTSEVVVPNLVGKTLTEAKTEAIDKKFELAIVDQQYMDKIPSETVYQQKPEPGRRIRENKQVSLWVSRGPRMAAVPDVRDMSFDLARRVIEKNGLRVGNYTYEYDPLAARGNVLRQSPEGSDNRPRGTKIDLVLSKGEEPTPTPEPLPVPDYVPEDSPAPDATPENPDATPTPVLSDDPDSKTRTFGVEYKVPRDNQVHRVRIDVIDRDGPRTVYDETLQTGDKAAMDVQGIGKKITIKIYDNDTLRSEQTK
jgi:serine/threonine protein kinase